MKRASFVMQSGLALRALAVIIVILTATTTAWAEEITIDLADGHGSATFSEESLVFSKCEALEVGFTFDIPLEVMTQSKMYAGVVMQRYTATLDNGDVVDGVLTGEIDVVSSQTYRYKVTGNEMTRQPVSVSMTRSRSTNPTVEIATWSGFRKGAASFTFDDGAPSHVSDAGPMFKKYGYKATFNLVYNWNPNWSGFQGLADEGHEIASHSNSHSNNMSGEEASSKKSIEGKINQKYGVITVAYPNCNVPNESAVLQNYIVGRICNGSWKGMNDEMGKDGPSNWAQVPATMTGSEGQLKSTNDFTGRMQKVIQSNGWAAFLTHGFQGKNNGNATYSPTDLGAIDGALKWAHENDKDIWVAPMGHVAMYIKERKASKVEVTQSDEFSMIIKLTHEIADNVSDYDYPLSLRVSSGWTNVAVTQAGAKLESKVDDGYIYFDAIPNGGDIVMTNTGIYCGNTAVNDGKNVVWEYDATTKTLTIRKNPKASEISGEDFTMMDFVSGADAPWAFYSSSITTVYVEDGVQGIGNSAFDGCTNLKTVYVLRDNTDGITTLGTDAFKNCHDDLTIYVFATALSDYQNAENWSNYASKLKGLGSRIPYLDWDDTEKKLVKKTTPANVGVLVLDGTESVLGTAGQETWYVCNTPVSDEKPNGLEYNGKLTLNGDVHLILADGCKMTIYPGENDENAYSLYGSNSDLAIYGQGSTDATGISTEGQLTVTALLVGIDVNNLTINGGQVIASSKGEGIVIWTLEDITINGGQVTVTSNDGPKGIYAERDVTINGGQVMVTETNCQDGIYADRDVTINGGQVTATVKKGSGINVRGNVTISGGQVEANGKYGIMATGYKDNQNNIWVDGNVTISGGKVTATGTKDSGIGIEAYNDIFFSGGQVEATGTTYGIHCSGNLDLSWMNTTDFIKASSISVINNLNTAAGKRFVVYNPVGEGETELAAYFIIGDVVSTTSSPFYALTVISGKAMTLRPLDGYLLTSPFVPVDKAANISETNPTGADFAFTNSSGVTTVYYVYDANDVVTLSLPNLGQKGIVLTSWIEGSSEVPTTDLPVNINNNAATTTFTMPAGDLFIKSARYYAAGVDYMDWVDSQKKLVSKNTATDDNDANDKVWILDGTETALNGYDTETWCVVPNDGISYSSALHLNCNVHIILTDGATMNHKQITTYRLLTESLTIHGQSEGTGKLTGGSLDVDGDITIDGGIIELYGESFAISPNGNIFYNGGQVTATGSNYGIGFETRNKNIVLRWSKISDFIQASSFNLQQLGSVMKIAMGKYFLVDGTTTVLGSADADYELSAHELTAIAGKKLLPIEGIPTDGVAYIAFTNGSGNRKPLGDDVQVYAVVGYNLTAGQVYLKPIEGNVIPEGMPVVIGNKTEDDPLPANIFLVGSDAQTTTVEGLLKGFVACDGSKTVQEYLDESFGEGVSASDYIPYLLKGGSFKAVLVNADDVIKQDICLLFIPKWDVLTGKSVGSTNATRSIGIGEGGETTRIRPPLTPPTQEGKGCAQWYDMQGRRIEKPTRKGLYIRNGVKVVIK